MVNAHGRCILSYNELSYIYLGCGLGILYGISISLVDNYIIGVGFLCIVCLPIMAMRRPTVWGWARGIPTLFCIV